MKPHTLLILLLAFLSACSAKEKNGEEAGTKKELASKKEKLEQLRQEVRALEQAVAENDTTRTDRTVLVELKPMEPTPFRHHFEVNGTVEADKDVMVSPETQGKLDRILVEEGDRVQKGDLMAVQSTTVLEQQLEEVGTNLEHARVLYEKQKRLWKEKNIGSEVEYLNAKNRKESLEQKRNTLKEQLEMARIKAPVSGVVEDIFQKEGAYSSPAQPFARVVNLRDLYINADVSEFYLPKVNVGDEVGVEFPNLGVSMEAPIHRTGDVIDPQNRTFTVRLKIRNVKSDLIKPNSLASLKVTDFATDSALLVPSGIIQQDLKGDYLYVKGKGEDGNVAKKTYVTTGMSQKGRVMIEEGLKAGDEVVVMGYDQLTNNTSIREKQ